VFSENIFLIQLKGEDEDEDEENLEKRHKRTFKDLSEDSTKAVVEFSNSSLAVIENQGTLTVRVERYGNLEESCHLR
jgi:hypothetical protein